MSFFVACCLLASASLSRERPVNIVGPMRMGVLQLSRKSKDVTRIDYDTSQRWVVLLQSSANFNARYFLLLYQVSVFKTNCKVFNGRILRIGLVLHYLYIGLHLLLFPSQKIRENSGRFRREITADIPRYVWYSQPESHELSWNLFWRWRPTREGSHCVGCTRSHYRNILAKC